MKSPAPGAAASPGDSGVTAMASVAAAPGRAINSVLWHACAGPLVSLPPVGSLVVYFPQGHSEQVAASMQKSVDGHIPNYPNIPSKLICLLHNVTLHADPETDEVYAQLTLQPVSSYEPRALQLSELALKQTKPQMEFFCKTLTASDTSTHGGFSVPRRAAEKIFPQLDFSMQPPAQELQATDLHENVWQFRHIYRGQPKRHLLTTGWSIFVSGKRLFSGDSVLFVRDEKQQLLLGIRRANRQPTNVPSSVLSSDSMHIGILAAAAHAAANHSPFTVFYNPRASPCEFVVPFAKYQKAVYGNQISLGMRFRMMFETEELSTRRYMGTITGISDLDPARWKNSEWRNLQVGWDESGTGERRTRVSIWEIDPVIAPFFICPPPFFSGKRPRQLDEESSEMENLFKRAMPWLGEEICIKDPQTQTTVMPGMSLVQWMSLNMKQSPAFTKVMMQAEHPPPLASDTKTQSLGASDLSQQHQVLNNIQFGPSKLLPPVPATAGEHPVTAPVAPDQLAAAVKTQQMAEEIGAQQGQHQSGHLLPPPLAVIKNQLPQPLLPLVQSQQALTGDRQSQQQLPPVPSLQQQVQQLHLSDQQLQLQILRKLQQQQQQQCLMTQHGMLPSLNTEQHKALLDAQQVLQQHEHEQMQEVFQQKQFVHSELSDAVLPHISSAAIAATTAAGAPQSALTEDIPSCSTSPSTTSANVFSPPVLNKIQRCGNPGDFNNMTQPNARFSIPCVLESAEAPPRAKMESQRLNGNVKQGLPAAPKSLNGDNTGLLQPDYLEAISTASPVWLTPSDEFLHQSFQGVPPSAEADNLGNGGLFGACGDDGLFSVPQGTNLFSSKYQQHSIQQDIIGNGYMIPNDAQQEMSSSMVSQSFATSDAAFNSIDSIDSGISDSAFLNRSNWARPPPSFQRMRTFTKVHKRGAVSRCIDITRFSGYDELKSELTHMFNIEGQLEDRQRIGWKLVYEDLENDTLLLGDDPWEDFVKCVKCIRILSPQEVQQDIASNVLPNQAGAWRGTTDRNAGCCSPSIGSYGKML